MTTPIRTCTFTSPKARAISTGKRRWRSSASATTTTAPATARRTSAASAPSRPFSRRSPSSCCRSATSRTSPRWWIFFYTYVKTDLTTGNLVWLGNEALNIGTENIHFATLPGDGSGYYNKQSVYVLDAQATCDLVNEALNPYNEALTLEDMDILVP